MEQYCMHCLQPYQPGASICPVCNKPVREEIPAHHLLPGTVLNKKFYIGHALGEGGFGITYIGRDLMLDMLVAIKEYYPNGCVYRSNTVSPQVNSSSTEDRKEQFRKGRERFLREARVLAKFSGEPGIVDVRDFFEEYNTAYIVMEFLDGETLKSYLKREERLPAEKAVSLLMPVMLTLRQVHAHGLIHRDISPDNIMLVRDKVKLLDFGAARDVTDSNKSLSVMLKPGYAPEEQYRSKGQQGSWTDVYALCATIYKCITGITPDDSMQRVYHDEVRPVSALGIAISPALDAALMKGMAIMQTHRYQNIDELLYGMEHEQPKTAVAAGVRGAEAVSNEDGATIFVDSDDLRNRSVAEAPVQISQPAASSVCHRCGKELKTGIKFCTGCGARQDAKAIPAPKPLPTPEPDVQPAPVPVPAPAPVPVPAPAPVPVPAPAPIAPVTPPAPSAPIGQSCSVCGKILKPGAKFCTICGTKAEASAAPITPPVPPHNGEICKTCGTALKPGAKFCTYCGTKTAVSSAVASFPAANLCAVCAHPLKPGAKFCTLCGTGVGNTGNESSDPALCAPLTPQGNVCRRCGKEYKPGQRFCTVCGSALD